MFAISNDELAKAPDLGDFILCDRCGQRHKLEYVNKILENGTKRRSKSAAFVLCCGKLYLVGINGKDIRNK